MGTGWDDDHDEETEAEAATGGGSGGDGPRPPTAEEEHAAWLAERERQRQEAARLFGLTGDDADTVGEAAVIVGDAAWHLALPAVPPTKTIASRPDLRAKWTMHRLVDAFIHLGMVYPEMALEVMRFYHSENGPLFSEKQVEFRHLAKKKRGGK